MLERFRGRLANWLAPPVAPVKPRMSVADANKVIRDLAEIMRIQRRQYEAAQSSRLTSGWLAPTSSADAELAIALPRMRDRSRALIRDSGYANRAKQVIVNNVIGSGIGMQAQVKNARGTLIEPINAAIEEAFSEWSAASRCHTGGRLHFGDLERQLMGQVVEAGDVLVRLHPRKFGDSSVPLALEIIEGERVADELYYAQRTANDTNISLGVELDFYGRPVNFLIRTLHPGDVRTNANQKDRIDSVSADTIIHLYIVNRWPQTRGEPWLHTAMRRLNDMNGYSDAEIVAARAAACYFGVIQTPEDAQVGDQDGESGVATAPEIEMEAGLLQRLAPGEEFQGFSPNRPNSAMDPFMRLMLREVATGIGTSYESISRDYSQSNYSSSRLALIEDRDTWRHLQTWFIRSFRQVLHARWMDQAVLAGAIKGVDKYAYLGDRKKFLAVAFKPRGWTWVDPTKEVEAYKEAIKGGLTTRADVIAQTANGADIEDIDQQRERELAMAAEKGLAFDTDPAAYMPPEPQAPPGDPPPDDSEDEDNTERPAKAGRVVSMGRF